MVVRKGAENGAPAQNVQHTLNEKGVGDEASPEVGKLYFVKFVVDKLLWKHVLDEVRDRLAARVDQMPAAKSLQAETIFYFRNAHAIGDPETIVIQLADDLTDFGVPLIVNMQNQQLIGIFSEGKYMVPIKLTKPQAAYLQSYLASHQRELPHKRTTKLEEASF